ncbi:MAG TPA: hypothetical protein VFH63_00695 [candidate division Zixibacteria bacterium]|nr:hypothetical protein [candidate division Zixibacteria bacterium]
MSETPSHLPEDGPTELAEGRDGELVERLSTGTATLLLVWLIGIGAASALLAAWVFAALFLGERLGLDALFSGVGFYVALFGAGGPTILWLAGRAQDHSLGWFVVTAAKIGLAMIGGTVAIGAAGILMLGGSFGSGALSAAAVLIGLTLVLSVLWALAVWSADRYIARARVEGVEGRGPDQTS